MLKKIIISESQFNRLFINEQIGGGISGIGNISKELPITDRKSPDFKKLLDSIDVHTVIDIAAIVSLAIPLYGLAISSGLELLNGVLYIAEGDKLSGGLSIGLSLIPGGLILRRSLSSKKILSKVDDLLIKNPKILKSKDPNEVIDLIKKGLGKDADKNIDLIIKYINTIKKIPVDKLQDFQKLIKQYPKLFTEFTKNEKILKQYLESNNNNFYNAFKTFISKYTKKEVAVSGIAYITLPYIFNFILKIVKKHIESKYSALPEKKKEKITKDISVIIGNNIMSKISKDTKKIDSIIITNDTLKSLKNFDDSIKIVADTLNKSELYIINNNHDELMNYFNELEKETEKDSIIK